MSLELQYVHIPGPVIIGAGPSGLATAVCLKQKGIPSLILEKENCIGSLWKIKTYDSLKLHLPKDICQLPHMPFPSDFPTYPAKQHFIAYLEAYANKFSVQPLFGQEFKCAFFDSKTRFWQVETGKFVITCKWLIVATGENAEPVMPCNFAGISYFKGRLLHSSEYKNGAGFAGRKVLVLGCGNSGMEISLDLCNNGAQVSLVIRNKLHILPKEILGRSTLCLSMWLLKWLPVKLVDWLLVICSRLVLGDTSAIGIRRPEIGPFELKNSVGKTPVLDVGVVAKIKSGEIKVVCGIEKFTKKGVEFVDGKIEEFESVILATGYTSNLTSWLKEENLFEDWKGKNGAYSVGFSRRGLLGTSIDAHKVAEDIASQWTQSEGSH